MAPQPGIAINDGPCSTPRGDLRGELADLLGQFTAPLDKAAGNPRDGSRESVEVSRSLVEGAEPVQGSGLRFPGRVELVQVPAQPTNRPSPLSDKGFTMITEQPHVAVRTIQPGHRKIGLPLSGPCYGERIDRVGLAVGPCRVTDVGHQLWRLAGVVDLTPKLADS